VTEEYRQAVALAEAQSMTLGPAALAKDGGALPEVPAAPPPPDPGSAQSRGSLDVEISGVRFFSSVGEVQAVDTEEPLDISIEFTTRRPVEDVGFGIMLFDSQGTQVYGTNTFIESVRLPTPLPPAGTLRLSLKRVGLTPGVYTLDVYARPAQGQEYDHHKGMYRLTVHSDIDDSGIARPPHVWSLEPARAIEPLSPGRAAEV
jgi:lipopolysaccharide transport system ATP-binding protein